MKRVSHVVRISETSALIRKANNSLCKGIEENWSQEKRESSTLVAYITTRGEKE
jgi:hypothetical protein